VVNAGWARGVPWAACPEPRTSHSALGTRHVASSRATLHALGAKRGVRSLTGERRGVDEGWRMAWMEHGMRVWHGAVGLWLGRMVIGGSACEHFCQSGRVIGMRACCTTRCKPKATAAWQTEAQSQL
jgi:hypothetical protein